jgi:heptosyltransferase-2
MRRCLVPPARVLVRMPSWLGDFVMAEPVVRALLERWSGAKCPDRITLAGPSRFLELLAPLRASGARFVACERGADPDARAWADHDVALLLDGSWRSAWSAFAARIPERVGFAGGGRAALLTQWIAPAKERGAAALGVGSSGAWPRRLPRPFGSACVELAAACGLEVRERAPRLARDPAAIERVEARLADLGVRNEERIVLVHAGARTGSAKGVPPAQWAAILQELDTGARIVLTCAPGEEANARAVRELVPGALLFDDPPLDVTELLAAHAFADLVLTSDSGPRHLAQAAGRSATVVLCGPTDPRHTSDHGPRVHVARAEVPCGPCHRERCPLAGDARHACMTRIDPRNLAPLLASVPLVRAARSPARRS